MYKTRRCPIESCLFIRIVPTSIQYYGMKKRPNIPLISISLTSGFYVQIFKKCFFLENKTDISQL